MFCSEFRSGMRATELQQTVSNCFSAVQFAPASFQVAFDKGALDALMGEDTEAAGEAGSKLLSEVQRVLTEQGQYICVTLAQPHVLSKYGTLDTSCKRWSVHAVFSARSLCMLCQVPCVSNHTRQIMTRSTAQPQRHAMCHKSTIRIFTCTAYPYNAFLKTALSLLTHAC